MVPLRVAVIGSGASAYAVLLALRDSKQPVEVTVFESGPELEAKPSPTLDSTIHSPFDLNAPPFRKKVADFYSRHYLNFKKKHDRRFPPVKSHFGEPLPQWKIEGKNRFAKSQAWGGLTRYWGGSAFPFSSRDFEGFPFTQSELAPYYQILADAIGVSGCQDPLSTFYGQEYSNRPPIPLSPSFQRLVDGIGKKQVLGYEFSAGVSRLALETRPQSPNSCIRCGECMAGCFRDSVWSAGRGLRSDFASMPFRTQWGRVWTIQESSRRIELRKNQTDASTWFGPFDRIFLCAGAVHSAEIVMRSMGITKGPTLLDNVIFQFPILHFGKSSFDPDQYLGITNAVIAARSLDLASPSPKDAQIQIYPNMDYLWRMGLPEWAWKLARPFVRSLRDRVMWARAYLHSDQGYAYEMSLDPSRYELEFRSIRAPGKEAVQPVLNSLRKALQGTGFWIPPITPVMSGTSSHLAGSIPFGGKAIPVSASGEVFSQTYLCDSSFFPSSPASSPTLTAMANAYKTVIQSLQKETNRVA